MRRQEVRKEGDAETLEGRARLLMIELYPDRGRFVKLDLESRISVDSWKGAWYGRQRFTAAMLEHLCLTKPGAARWLLTGAGSLADPADGVELAAAELATQNLQGCAAEVLEWRTRGSMSTNGSLAKVAALFEAAASRDPVTRAVDCVVSVALRSVAKKSEVR